MPKRREKADLPVKTCAACGRPMVWRKAWAKNWDAVKYCSDRCRADGKRGRAGQAAAPRRGRKAYSDV